MTTMLRTMSITNAAWREAVRLRHPEADVDHHLLGLLAAGGPAAELLGTRGVTLADARRAAFAQRRAGLAPLGLDASAVADPEPLPATDLHREAAGDAPTSRRASTILADLPRRWSELDLLVALVSEPSGTNGAVLAACGVDVDALVADARAGRTAAGIDPHRCDPIADLAPTRAGTVVAAATMTHMISAPVEVIRAAAAAPQQTLIWLGLGDEGVVASPDRLRLPRSRRGREWAIDVTRVVDEPSGDGHRVAWQETFAAAGDEWDGAPGGYHDLRLRAVPGGTLVAYTRGLRTFGRLARHAMLIARLGATAAMPRAMQDLAFVAADLDRG